jgi:hypothetical protein
VDLEGQAATRGEMRRTALVEVAAAAKGEVLETMSWR